MSETLSRAYLALINARRAPNNRVPVRYAFGVVKKSIPVDVYTTFSKPELLFIWTGAKARIDNDIESIGVL